MKQKVAKCMPGPPLQQFWNPNHARHCLNQTAAMWAHLDSRTLEILRHTRTRVPVALATKPADVIAMGSVPHSPPCNTLNSALASPQLYSRTRARLGFRCACLQSGHAFAHCELTLRAPRASAWTISWLLDVCPALMEDLGASRSKQGVHSANVSKAVRGHLMQRSSQVKPTCLSSSSSSFPCTCHTSCCCSAPQMSTAAPSAEGQTMFFSMPSRLFGSAPPSEPFMILTSAVTRRDLFPS